MILTHIILMEFLVGATDTDVVVKKPTMYPRTRRRRR